jgi:hypothetical protein
MVVVPFADLNGNMMALTSGDGGSTWTPAVRIATVPSHTEAGGLRSGGLPSSAVDSSGIVYVVWSDCRFRTNCASNDLVMSTSSNGTIWSAVSRIPIDLVTSTADHFITGLSVDPATGGSTAHLGLVYYYYPVSACTIGNCRLDVGYISSSNGGKTWTAKTKLAGPMSLGWLPNTFSGTMVADYITVAFSGGKAFPIFSLAFSKSGSLFHQAIYTTSVGFSAAVTGAAELSSAADVPIPGAKSDHGPMQYYDLDHEKPIPGRGGKPPRERELESPLF